MSAPPNTQALWRVTIVSPRKKNGETSLYLRARRTVDGKAEERRWSTDTTDMEKAEILREERERRLNPEHPGFIYFIRNTRSRSVKVGWSRDPKQRLFSVQTGSEDELVMERVTEGSRGEEGLLHRLLAGERVRGEWYRGVLVDGLAAGGAP